MSLLVMGPYLSESVGHPFQYQILKTTLCLCRGLDLQKRGSHAAFAMKSRNLVGDPKPTGQAARGSLPWGSSPGPLGKRRQAARVMAKQSASPRSGTKST